MAVAAEHHELAGDSALALEYYDRARRHAESRFAYEAGLKLIERALAQPALTAPRQRFLLLAGRQVIYDRIDRKEEWEAAVRSMHEWAESQDDDAMRARVNSARMLRADHDGQPEEARQKAEHTLVLTAGSEDPFAASPTTLAHGELAWLAVARHDCASADLHLEQGLVHARRSALLSTDEGGYDGYEVQLRSIQIRALITRERYAEAVHALELGMPRFHLAALVHAAEAALAQGDMVAAKLAADQALQLSRVAGSEFARPGVHRCLGRLALARGDLPVARRLAAVRFNVRGPRAPCRVLWRPAR